MAIGTIKEEEEEQREEQVSCQMITGHTLSGWSHLQRVFPRYLTEGDTTFTISIKAHSQHRTGIEPSLVAEAISLRFNVRRVLPLSHQARPFFVYIPVRNT